METNLAALVISVAVLLIAIVSGLYRAQAWWIRRRHPRASAAADAYMRRFGTARRIVIPDTYREAEDQQVEAALSAHELYKLREAQARTARLHYVKTLHDQGEHHQCSTDCPAVINATKTMYTRDNLNAVVINIKDVEDTDLEEFAASITDEMKRRRGEGGGA
jgi:hypothetical protein